MSMGLWLAAAALSAQSLGEVAEREKERRERNAAEGVEVVSYAGTGEALSAEAPEEARDPEESGEPNVESPLEAERERGKILEPLLLEISVAADNVDRLYQRYMDRCYNRYLVGSAPPGIGVGTPAPSLHVGAGRDWFLVLETPSAFTTPVPAGPDRTLVLVQTPECQQLWEDLVTGAREVQTAMRELLDLARRERILPGVVRELRRKYRLEWSGWER